MDTSENKPIEIFVTSDGSHSLYVPELDETYHSRHGAVQESLHVFIEKGLKFRSLQTSSIRLLEVGFGTGLNAWLTLKESEILHCPVHYVTLETRPLALELVEKLNYVDPDSPAFDDFLQIHRCDWNREVKLNSFFSLEKRNVRLQEFEDQQGFDLIYYDAFGPPTQPEMWEPEVFKQLFSMTKPGGVLVTYCAKGQVRRNMTEAGFQIERLQGPPGKREMLRATKSKNP